VGHLRRPARRPLGNVRALCALVALSSDVWAKGAPCRPRDAMAFQGASYAPTPVVVEIPAVAADRPLVAHTGCDPRRERAHRLRHEPLASLPVAGPVGPPEASGRPTRIRRCACPHLLLP